MSPHQEFDHASLSEGDTTKPCTENCCMHPALGDIVKSFFCKCFGAFQLVFADPPMLIEFHWESPAGSLTFLTLEPTCERTGCRPKTALAAEMITCGNCIEVLGPLEKFPVFPGLRVYTGHSYAFPTRGLHANTATQGGLPALT